MNIFQSRPSKPTQFQMFTTLKKKFPLISIQKKKHQDHFLIYLFIFFILSQKFLFMFTFYRIDLTLNFQCVECRIVLQGEKKKKELRFSLINAANKWKRNINN